MIQTLFFHDTKILYYKYGIKIFKNLEVLKKNILKNIIIIF